MKIKLKTLYASSSSNYQPGEVGEFSDSEGNALVNGGYGIEIDKKIETAVIRPVETASISPLVVKQIFKKPIKKVNSKVKK